MRSPPMSTTGDPETSNEPEGKKTKTKAIIKINNIDGSHVGNVGYVGHTGPI